MTTCESGTPRRNAARGERLRKCGLGGIWPAIVFLTVLGLALIVLASTRRNPPVLVIAHHGSSATAPENMLVAFRLGAEQGADFIQRDAQESASGARAHR